RSRSSAFRPLTVVRELEAEAQKQYYGKIDRKSTRLNSSHLVISYAVFCLKKKKQLPSLPYNRRLTSSRPLRRERRPSEARTTCQQQHGPPPTTHAGEPHRLLVCLTNPAPS